ncbi:hypothetical protein [Marinobacter bohaiensis]|uniref:hypothetical protein n=1 Tax=Marinobacter bohaiensis TaxID=2201898 RepID=UPI000DAE7F47|nr:hypothetical protein [Marinobacter bohaiensis]
MPSHTLRATRGATVACTAILLAACAGTPDEPPKPMTADVEESVVTEPGVPGGIQRRTARISATVKAIDYSERSVTLVDDNGGEKTITIGPEAVNFNQVEKGDQVNVEYAEETVVFLRELGEMANDGAAGLATRAEEGGTPAGFAGATTEITALVTGVDLANHTATLMFPDGTEAEVPVRPDVALSDDQVGREVVIRTTAAVALSVEKQE